MKKTNNKLKIINTLSSAIIAILGISNLSAEEADSQNTDAGEAKDNLITVTASRRTETLQNVGLSITAVDPADFVGAGLGSLENIIDYTPGVNFRSGGSPGAGSVTMRGASQESSSAVVGIYVDDVPFTSGSPFSFAGNFMFDGVLGEIERIEIVKGPQGTLYGANAVGGVIRYVTRDPSVDKLRAGVSMDLSSTEQGTMNQQFRANISMPLIEDKLGISVSAFSSDQGGFIDRVTTPSSPYEKNINDAESSGYNLAALWNISEKATLKFSGLHYESKNDGVNGIDLNYPSQTPTYGRYKTDEPAGSLEPEYDSYSLTLNIDFDWAKLTSVSAFVEYKVPLFQDGTENFGGLADLFTGSPFGTNTVPVPIFASSKKTVQELRLTSPQSEQFEWLVGLFYTDEETDNTQSAIASPTGFNLFEVAFPSDYKETAVFGNLTWYLSPDFDVSLGARYSDNSLTLRARFAGLFAAGDPNGEVLFGDTIEDEVVTYSLGARYRLDADTSFYARVASGYRPAAVNLPIFDPFTGENLVEPIIDSDELISYEFGVKGSVLDRKVRYDFALWAIDWDAFQANIVVSGISTGGNAETAIVANGMEGTVTFYPTDSFSISTNFAYSNSELDGDDATLGALKGEASRQLPEWTASMMANYDFEIAELDASIGGGIRYVGDFTTSYKGGVVGTGGLLVFPVDANTQVDLNANLTNGKYSLTLYVTNLLDDDSLTDAVAFDSYPSPIATGSIVQPRTVGVVISMSF